MDEHAFNMTQLPCNRKALKNSQAPEVIEQMTKLIANNFVSDRNIPEVMTVGLNAIREICMRCPLGIDEAVLWDLIEYRSYRDKNVSAAAKALLNVYRERNPSLLPRKLRCLPAEVSVCGYGEQKIETIIPGAEAIAKPDDCSEADCAESKKENVIKADCKEAASKIIQTRILTDDELKRIKQQQIAQSLSHIYRPEKRKSEFTNFTEMSSEDEKEEEILSLSVIEELKKKPKLTKEEKLEEIKQFANVKEKRENRPKFGRKIKKTNAGISNKEKKKTKLFTMVKHKFKKKEKRSFREKQISLRDALLKQKKLK